MITNKEQIRKNEIEIEKFNSRRHIEPSFEQGISLRQLKTCVSCYALGDFLNHMGGGAVCKFCGEKESVSQVGNWDKKEERWILRKMDFKRGEIVEHRIPKMPKHPTVLCDPFIVLEYAWRAVEQCKGGNVIECGVFEGFTSAMLNWAFRKSEYNVEQYAADTFCGMPYDGQVDEKYKKGDLAPCENVELTNGFVDLEIIPLIGKVEGTLQSIDDKKFCFVFLDMDLETPTRFAFEFFKTRLVPGAIIGFHDYGTATLPGITRVVNEAMKIEYFEEVFRDGKERKRDHKFFFMQWE